MAYTWQSIFKGIIESRPVEIEAHRELGYRVHTLQGKDEPAAEYSEGPAVIITTPAEQGRPVTIDGETPDEIYSSLLEEGFSEEAANLIIGKL